MNKDYIYSKLAAARILGIQSEEVLDVQGGLNVINVKTKKGNKFVSPKKFIEGFAQFRQDAARHIEIWKIHDSFWQAKSETGSNLYDIRISGTRIQCNCKDFTTQQELNMPKQCCKHIYAVLQSQGFHRLKDFENRLRPREKPSRVDGLCIN